MFAHDPPWLPLSLCEALENYARQRGVSVIARSGRGFLTAYKIVSGEPAMLGRDPYNKKHWTEVRRLYINRNLGSATKNREKMWITHNGHEVPSRRHLALIMWAYSPTPRRLHRWVRQMAHQERQKLETKNRTS
tara:strand:+ start:285 stop:686 length:402 start_codon:yes stop_codon:yes gene_type:complete